MKLTHLFTLSLGLSLGFTSTSAAGNTTEETDGTYWANGLEATYTEENGWKVSGWYDAQKTEEKEADDNMCYAASAANLLAWWQNSEDAPASAAPRDLDTIWDTFVRNNQIKDEGGDALSAINWWMSGVYAPSAEVSPQPGNESGSAWKWADESAPEWERYFSTYEECAQSPEVLPMTLPNYTKDGQEFGGYYYDQYGLTQSELSAFLQEVWSYQEPDDAETSGMFTVGDSAGTDENEEIDSIVDVDFKEILKDSAISLGIISDEIMPDDGSEPEEGLAHAITLWGVMYEDGKLTQLYLTDSDDYENPEATLFTLSVELNENDNKIYFGEKNENGDYESAYGTNVYINAIYALDTTVTQNWQLVPEPTTATLSLLALAALAARRRRQ